MLSILKKYKNDVILVFSILLIALVFIVVWVIRYKSYDGDLYANVYYKDDCLYSLDLDDDISFEMQGYESKMIIEVKDGQVRVRESGCHDQICVHTGWMKKKGRTITCLPNKVWIEIGKEVKVNNES
ncbi:MAG: NusG domain II-containing protein [Acholeplasmatales bacterium]|nr:NusG domain II-containing protein [Acholeplasmatales bacterium]